MKNCVLLFLLLISLTTSTVVVSVSDNVKLGWYFPTLTTITFYLYVPGSKLGRYDWGYYGLGFKNSGSSSNMNGADFTTVILATGDVESRDSLGNEYTPLSDESGFTELDFEPIGDYMVYTWTRDLNTGILGDIILKADTDYKVLWAWGPVNESNQVLFHPEWGSVTINLAFDNDKTTIDDRSFSFNLVYSAIMVLLLAH